MQNDRHFHSEFYTNPLSPHDVLKHHFTSLNRLNFLQPRVLEKNISMKLVYQYMAIFFTFSTTSHHMHSLQVGNCDSNSRFVVDEYDNVKSGLKDLSRKYCFCNQINFIDEDTKLEIALLTFIAGFFGKG